MGLLQTDIIEPGETSAVADGVLLDDLEGLAIDASNLRTGAVALPHFAAERSPVMADSEMPITAWVDHKVYPEMVSVHSSTFPGTWIGEGSTVLVLEPPDGERGTLNVGEVLRYHFTAMVTEVDDVDAELDLYGFTVEITGTNAAGTTQVYGYDHKELGISPVYSMNQGALETLVVGVPANVVNQRVQQQRVGFSFVYIHDPTIADVFAGPGPVHIDTIRVRCFVQADANTVTVEMPSLTAMILKG